MWLPVLRHWRFTNSLRHRYNLNVIQANVIGGIATIVFDITRKMFAAPYLYTQIYLYLRSFDCSCILDCNATHPIYYTTLLFATVFHFTLSDKSLELICHIYHEIHILEAVRFTVFLTQASGESRSRITSTIHRTKKLISLRGISQLKKAYIYFVCLTHNQLLHNIQQSFHNYLHCCGKHFWFKNFVWAKKAPKMTIY